LLTITHTWHPAVAFALLLPLLLLLVPGSYLATACSHIRNVSTTSLHVCTPLQILAEKNIKYTSKYVDLFNGQSLSPEYLAVNPAGTVPALKDGDKVIGDSK
jgi:hypothetical protein